MPKRFGRGGEIPMVPEAAFASYYGKAIVKAAPWGKDIPAYLFLGGLAGGSSLLAAGADLTNNPVLRRNGRMVALGAIGMSYIALVHDLGKPSRFFNMMRVAKPTSPMSIGTWIISAYGPMVGLAAANEMRSCIPSKAVANLLRNLGRPAGLVAAILAPLVSSYTAVLLGNTATPSWHDGFNQMPFIFVSSAASASGGLAMAISPLESSVPAWRMAIGGAAGELLAMKRMEASMGFPAQALKVGKAGQLLELSKILTLLGLVGAVFLGRKSKAAATISGISLTLGSVFTRFGIFEAGQASARDPKYTIIPQREKADAYEREIN